VPYLSVREIESIARRVITAYRKLPALAGRQVSMVQPELLVRDLLGLSIEYHVLSANGNILGLTSCGEVGVHIYDNPDHPEYFFLDGKTLLVDSSLIAGGANQGRYHFTLTHEGCHQIFQMLFPKEYAGYTSRRQIHYCKSSPAADGGYWEEWRTNILTSFVLMPADMVRSNLEAFGLYGRPLMLNRVFARSDYDRFVEMADYMGVSKTALSIRLKRLGLLRADYLRNPYALADIYPEEGEL
jgi:hypothetical protein